MILFITSHVREAAEQESQEEIEDDQVGHQDRGQEVGNASYKRLLLKCNSFKLLSLKLLLK
jgi:hypothetical protein